MNGIPLNSENLDTIMQNLFKMTTAKIPGFTFETFADTINLQAGIEFDKETGEKKKVKFIDVFSHCIDKYKWIEFSKPIMSTKKNILNAYKYISNKKNNPSEKVDYIGSLILQIEKHNDMNILTKNKQICKMIENIVDDCYMDKDIMEYDLTRRISMLHSYISNNIKFRSPVKLIEIF